MFMDILAFKNVAKRYEAGCEIFQGAGQTSPRTVIITAGYNGEKLDSTEILDLDKPSELAWEKGTELDGKKVVSISQKNGHGLSYIMLHNNVLYTVQICLGQDLPIITFGGRMVRSPDSKGVIFLAGVDSTSMYEYKSITDKKDNNSRYWDWVELEHSLAVPRYMFVAMTMPESSVNCLRSSFGHH